MYAHHAVAMQPVFQAKLTLCKLLALQACHESSQALEPGSYLTDAEHQQITEHLSAMQGNLLVFLLRLDATCAQAWSDVQQAAVRAAQAHQQYQQVPGRDYLLLWELEDTLMAELSLMELRMVHLQQVQEVHKAVQPSSSTVP